VPADDARWNFVAEGKRQNRGVIAELGDFLDELSPNCPPQSGIVEKRDVLRPRKSYHHPQTVPHGLVQQFAVGHRVCANRVDSETRHQAEVFGHACSGRKLMAVRLGRKGAVGDAFDEKSFVAGAQKFPVNNDRSGRQHIGPDFRSGLKRSSHASIP
jgi:hypothetical protein